jgi:hypothetical protein
MAKSKKRRPPRPAPKAGLKPVLRLGPHLFPDNWQPLDWLAPLVAGHWFIQHGHTDPADHSACGPLLFCCLLAVEKYQRLPGSPVAGLDHFTLVNGHDLSPFLERGARMIYFIFCDPVRPEGLWAIGLEGEPLPQILFKQQPLEWLLSFPTVKRLA